MRVWAARKLCSLRPAPRDPGPLTQGRAGQCLTPLLDARNVAHRGPAGLHLKGQSHRSRPRSPGRGAVFRDPAQSRLLEGSHQPVCAARPGSSQQTHPREPRPGPERQQAPEATGRPTWRQRWTVAETSVLPRSSGPDRTRSPGHRSISLLRLPGPPRAGSVGPTPPAGEGLATSPSGYSGVLLRLLGDQMLDKRNLGFFLCSSPFLCRSGGEHRGLARPPGGRLPTASHSRGLLWPRPTVCPAAWQLCNLPSSCPMPLCPCCLHPTTRP